MLDVVNGTAGATVSIACGESLDGFTVGYTWGWEFVWTLREGVQRLEQHKYMECRFVSLTFSTPVQFTLSAWAVHYPWAEEDSSFSSSNSTLDAVYNLCRYTLHGAALDTYTDSNTRERTPYEADGIIAASSRLLVQRDVLWPRHSHVRERTGRGAILFFLLLPSAPPPLPLPPPPTLLRRPLCCRSPPGLWSGSRRLPCLGGRTSCPPASLTWRWPTRPPCWSAPVCPSWRPLACWPLRRWGSTLWTGCLTALRATRQWRGGSSLPVRT